MKWEAVVYGSIVLLLTACAAGPGPERGEVDTPPVLVEVQASNTFLNDEITPVLAEILPPAPQIGDPQNEADWAMFRQSRRFEGTDRWAMAINDDKYDPASILMDYSCALGVELTPEEVPSVVNLFERASRDAAVASDVAKNIYERPRPFLNNEGNICIERSERLDASFDYPSGHASAGWATGLVLASVAPERSTKILARARAYGESRAVCGLHNMSSVVAGRTVGASVFASMQGGAEFEAVVSKAKAELAAVRATAKAPDAVRCTAEAELVAPLAFGLPDGLLGAP